MRVAGLPLTLPGSPSPRSPPLFWSQVTAAITIPGPAQDCITRKLVDQGSEPSSQCQQMRGLQWPGLNPCTRSRYWLEQMAPNLRHLTTPWTELENIFVHCWPCNHKHFWSREWKVKYLRVSRRCPGSLFTIWINVSWFWEFGPKF